MSINGVFFDVDGTLSNSFQIGFSSTQQELLRNSFNEISEESYHQGTKYTTPQRLAWHTTGNPNDPSGEKLGQEFDDLYVALVSSITAPLYDGIPGLIDTILSTNRIKIAALSDACGSYVKAVMEVHDLQSKFHLSLGADEVPYAKPRPEGLLQICKSLDIDPSYCIYVGDSPSDGIAAKAANMKSIGVTWGSHPLSSIQPCFNIIVHSVELQREVLQFIER